MVVITKVAGPKDAGCVPGCEPFVREWCGQQARGDTGNPLPHAWRLWLSHTDDELVDLGPVAGAGDHARLLRVFENHGLPQHATAHLFRKNILPEAKERHNAMGGVWRVETDRPRAGLLWNLIVDALIDGRLTADDQCSTIVGVQVHACANGPHRIDIWTDGGYIAADPGANEEVEVGLYVPVQLEGVFDDAAVPASNRVAFAYFDHNLAAKFERAVSGLVRPKADFVAAIQDGTAAVDAPTVHDRRSAGGSTTATPVGSAAGTPVMAPAVAKAAAEVAVVEEAKYDAFSGGAHPLGGVLGAAPEPEPEPEPAAAVMFMAEDLSPEERAREEREEQARLAKDKEKQRRKAASAGLSSLVFQTARRASEDRKRLEEDRKFVHAEKHPSLNAQPATSNLAKSRKNHQPHAADSGRVKFAMPGAQPAAAPAPQPTVAVDTHSPRTQQKKRGGAYVAPAYRAAGANSPLELFQATMAGTIPPQQEPEAAAAAVAAASPPLAWKPAGNDAQHVPAAQRVAETPAPAPAPTPAPVKKQAAVAPAPVKCEAQEPPPAPAPAAPVQVSFCAYDVDPEPAPAPVAEAPAAAPAPPPATAAAPKAAPSAGDAAASGKKKKGKKDKAAKRWEDEGAVEEASQVDSNKKMIMEKMEAEMREADKRRKLLERQEANFTKKLKTQREKAAKDETAARNVIVGEFTAGLGEVRAAMEAALPEVEDKTLAREEEEAAARARREVEEAERLAKLMEERKQRAAANAVNTCQREENLVRLKLTHEELDARGALMPAVEPIQKAIRDLAIAELTTLNRQAAAEARKQKAEEEKKKRAEQEKRRQERIKREQEQFKKATSLEPLTSKASKTVFAALEDDDGNDDVGDDVVEQKVKSVGAASGKKKKNKKAADADTMQTQVASEAAVEEEPTPATTTDDVGSDERDARMAVQEAPVETTPLEGDVASDDDGEAEDAAESPTTTASKAKTGGGKRAKGGKGKGKKGKGGGGATKRSSPAGSPKAADAERDVAELEEEVEEEDLSHIEHVAKLVRERVHLIMTDNDAMMQAGAAMVAFLAFFVVVLHIVIED